MDFLSSIVVKIGEYLVLPIEEQFGYLISYKSSIMILEENFSKLCQKKEAVQHSVDGAQWNQEVVSSEVKTWLTNVKKKVEEVQKFLEEDVKTNRMCMNDWCPNLKLRYSLGKKAQKNTQVIAELIEEGGAYDRVYNIAPPLKVRSSSAEWFKDFESRKSMIQNILEALRDEKINMIALCGMGGIGKTEMAKEIARRVEEDGLFKKVAIAVVSQSPNLTKIQGELAEMLGPRLDVESLQGRADELYSRLTKSKSVLVILDDVWEPLDLKDLEAIGVYHAVKEKSCKILMTSRMEETCNQMRFQKIFPIGLLSEEEAWNLFREMAGDCINTPNLISIAKAVAKECGCLPIAIATVGSALRNKRDEYEWKTALQQLKMSIPQYISGMHPKVYSSIEFSYNYLGSDEAKSCCLLCCLYPDDYDIPIEHLVRYGVAKRFLKVSGTVEQTRAHVNAIVRNLRTSNLLLDSQKDECVKMHDVVRDVAISIASREEHGFMVELDRRIEEWPQKDTYDNYTTISLLLGEMKGHPDGLKCPKLQLLRLSCLKDSNKFPSNLFNGMNELKMLSLQEGCFSLTSLQLSIQILKNLRMLNLESCRLGDVSAIGSLGKLEILGFCDSEIEELPREIGNLSQLKLLDMKGCRSLKRIAAGVLSHLSRLQELYMGEFENWECTTMMEGNKEGTSNNASLAELVPYFDQMTVLEINVPSIDWLPKGLYFSYSKLRFRINIGNTGRYLLENASRYLFENAIRLNLEDASHDHWKVLESMGVFGSLKVCHITGEYKYNFNKDLVILTNQDEPNVSTETQNQTKMSSLFPYYLIQSLENLEILVASSCDSLEVIFELKGLNVEESNIFNNLTELRLDFLRKLLHIWKKGPRDIKGFNNLRLLSVLGCHSLKYLFTPSIAELLVKLEEINVYICNEMKEIIAKESGDEEKRDHVIAFPQVNTLWLSQLPKLECFCNEAIAFEWPSIKKIELWNCPKLKTFGSEIQSGRKLRKKDAELDARAPQEPSAGSSSASARESSRLFNRCLELSCIPRPRTYNPDQENCISSSEENKHNFNKDQVTLTYQDEPNVSIETKNQTKISSLFPYYLIQSLGNLEILKADECDSLEVIFELEGLNVEESNIFNNLTVVSLKFLPKLLHIWKKDLRDIKGFNNLRLLRVWGCDNLKCLFAPSIAKLLVKLEKIEVHKCKEIEEILEKESGDEETRRDVIVFPQVNTLSLMDLPKLEYFYTEDNYDFEWPSLENMTMVGCEHVKMFVSTSMKTPKLMGVHTEFEAFQAMIAGGLNTTIQRIMKGSKVNLLKILQSLSIRSREDLEYLSKALPNDQTLDLADAFCLVQSLELNEFFNLKEIYHTKPLWEISELGNLRSVKLYRCSSLKNVFSLAIAKGLVELQELTVRVCGNIEEILSLEGDDEKAFDVIKLPKLTNIKLECLPRLICFCRRPMDPVELDLQSTAQSSLNANEVEGGGTESITLSRKLFSSNTIMWVPNLELLQVDDCGSLVVLFDLEGLHVKAENHQPILALSHLRSLYLRKLDGMAHVWKNIPRGFQGFQNLLLIDICECHNLRNLLPTSVAKLLVQLQTVKVIDCKLMENVIQREDKAREDDQEAFDVIVLPKLTYMKLECLPRLIGICQAMDPVEFLQSTAQSSLNGKEVEGEGSTATFYHKLFSSNTILWFPNLDLLEIHDCGSLEVLFDLEGLHVKAENHQPILALSRLRSLDLRKLDGTAHLWKNIPRGFQGFQNLRLIDICECHNLRNLLPTSVAKLLVQLQTVKVIDCKLIENIIQREDVAGEEMREDLTTSFSSKAHSFEWSSIKKIELRDCPKLKTFYSDFESRRKLKKTEPSVGSTSIRKRDSVGLFNRCLESCVPGRSAKRSQGNNSSSLGGYKHDINKEVTLTKQGEQNVCEIENQINMWSLFPYNLIESLENLGELYAVKCDSLEVIFELEGLNVEESNIFHNLKVLRLEVLPKLLHIWKKDPQDIKGFNNLRLLQVWGCDNLKCLFAASIAKLLVKLDKIEVHNCKEIEEILEKESGDEERRDVIVFPQVNTLSLMDLPKFEYFYTEDNYAFEWPSLENMTVVGCQHLKKFVSTSMKTPKLMGVHTEFKAFQPVIEGDLNTTIQHIMKGSKVNLVEILQSLSIRSREDLEYLSEALPKDQTIDLAVAFCLVQSLELNKFFNLKEIYRTKPLWKISELGNLRSVKLYRCSSLKNVFSLAIAKGLVQLKELTVRVCENIEEILSLGGDDEKAFDVIQLPKLTNIKLECLPRLICFSQSTAQYSSLNGKEVARPIIESSSISSKLFSSHTILWVPNLEELVVNRLYIHGALFDLKGQDDLRGKNIPVLAQMRTLHLEELFCLAHVWKNIPPGFQGFQNLVSIEICKCHSLRYLFLTHVTNFLVKLQSISIISCKRMESIVQKEEAGEERGLDIIAFPRMSTINLTDVENLVSFSREACSFDWPSITKITLRTCPKLKTLGSKIQSPSKQQKTDEEKDSRAQEPRLASSSTADSPGFLSRCLECVPSSRSSSPVIESSQGTTKRPQEVTLTKQDEPNVSTETQNQTKMWSLFPYYLIQSLKNLEKLDAFYCYSLELIFELEGLNVEENNIFNNLTELRLMDLPKLLHIWKKGPRDIKGFNNLKFLFVVGCDSLKCLFTPSIAKLLVKLEQIIVDNCYEMEEIIAKELGDKEKRDLVIAFPQVKTLWLGYLPKLECFCNEAISFEWPSLETMIMDRCEKLKMFVSTSMKTPKLEGVHTKSGTFQPMIGGDLYTTIQHIIKEMANFQEISQSSKSP